MLISKSSGKVLQKRKKICVTCGILLFLLMYKSHCRDCNDFVQSIKLSYQRYKMSGNFTLFFFLFKSIYKFSFSISVDENNKWHISVCRMTLMFWIFLQIDHIFLSRVCSETAGGLPGLYLDRSAMVYLWSLTVFQFRIITKENVLVCSI